MEKRYENIKKELKRIKTALPALPSPAKLYDDIVINCQNVMHTTERFDRLKQDINVFYGRNLSFSELERDAYIIELTRNAQLVSPAICNEVWSAVFVLRR